MKMHEKRWSNKLWRYLWFVKELPNGNMIFEDAGDEWFVFTKEEVNAMSKNKKEV